MLDKVDVGYRRIRIGISLVAALYDKVELEVIKRFNTMRKTVSVISILVVAAFLLVGCAKESAEKTDTGTAGKEASTNMFELKTDAFTDGSDIPVKYANTVVTGGENVSVPLSWTGAPAGTKSFALVCVDRNPMANNWIHWLVINIPASTTSIPEGASTTDRMPAGTVELKNTFGNNKYQGPQPPSGTGPHEYEFILYALNVERIDVAQEPTFGEFEAAVKTKLIETAKISGEVER